MYDDAVYSGLENRAPIWPYSSAGGAAGGGGDLPTCPAPPLPGASGTAGAEEGRCPLIPEAQPDTWPLRLILHLSGYLSYRTQLACNRYELELVTYVHVLRPNPEITLARYGNQL